MSNRPRVVHHHRFGPGLSTLEGSITYLDDAGQAVTTDDETFWYIERRNRHKRWLETGKVPQMIVDAAGRVWYLDIVSDPDHPLYRTDALGSIWGKHIVSEHRRDDDATWTRRPDGLFETDDEPDADMCFTHQSANELEILAGPTRRL